MESEVAVSPFGDEIKLSAKPTHLNELPNGNSIHGAKRELMAKPIHDNEVVNSSSSQSPYGGVLNYNVECKM